MKFYFSGTGNSLYIAKEIGINDKLISIAKLMEENQEEYEIELKDNEALGFIFPIYAWAPPKMVLDFIKKLKIKNYNNNYTYFVTTCGENIGNTVEVVTKALKDRGIKIDSGFSIVMPNNYVIMGNTESKEAIDKKLKNSKLQIDKINEIINKRENGIFEVVKGPVPKLLTSVINPMFSKFATSTDKFYANDKCNGCGICEKVCNSNIIKVNGKPTWGKDCTGCLACLHVCPVKAINYGKGTENKGRYINPSIKKEDLFIR